MWRQWHANRNFLSRSLSSPRIYLRACVHFWTHVGALAFRYEIREVSPNGSYRAPRSHTRPHDDDIALLLSVPFASLSARAILCPPPLPPAWRSRSFSPFRLPLVDPKRRRWRLITTQSPLPVRLRDSDPFPESSNRLLPPWGIHHHRYRCCKTNNLRPVPRKKRPLPTPLRPVLRPFSPNHRRADWSSDYWHPGNPSIRIAAISPRRDLSRDEKGMH